MLDEAAQHMVEETDAGFSGEISFALEGQGQFDAGFKGFARYRGGARHVFLNAMASRRKSFNRLASGSTCYSRRGDRDCQVVPVLRAAVLSGPGEPSSGLNDCLFKPMCIHPGERWERDANIHVRYTGTTHEKSTRSIEHFAVSSTQPGLVPGGMRRGSCLADYPRSYPALRTVVPVRTGLGADAVKRALVAGRPPRGTRRIAQPAARYHGRKRSKAARQAERRGRRCRANRTTRTVRTF